MDSHEINQLPRTATNNGGGGVRRRPPAAAGGGASSSYGTNEEDALLSSQNEEGYGPVLQQSYARRRSSGGGGGHNYYNALPWYRQPQKLILVATFAWVGGVMYLASLAHAILRTHKETNNIMGISSMVENNDDFKGWLEARGMLKNAKTNNKKYGDSSSDSATNKATDEDVLRFLETYNSQSYKAKYGATNSGASSDADFQEWLGSQSQQQTNNNNKYGSSATNKHKKYGSSAETNADFKEWLDSTRRQTGSNKYGSSAGGSASAVDSELGDAWQDWLSYLSRENNNNGYGAANSGNNKASRDDNNVNVRFGSTTTNNNNNNGANAPQEWLDYQTMNKDAKYNANGMYGDANNNLAASLAETKALASAEQGDRQEQSPAIATSSDSVVSTIDWPLQGMPHQSCTASNGCSPSTNVTVLIVYGPEYHTHISEMAWNVATGVHAAFANHIQHHPSSPLHGHIIFGHTGNLTFLDVMDADAVIIGSPVYNGNVHPDIQNWINYWHIDADLSNKFGGAFATAGGIHAGADGTIMSILRSMMVFQMMAVGGDSWTSPFGAVATMYEDPFGDTQRTEYFQDSCYYTADAGRTGDHLVHPYFLRKAYGLGERIGNTTVAWKNSSYVRW